MNSLFVTFPVSIFANTFGIDMVEERARGAKEPGRSVDGGSRVRREFEECSGHERHHGVVHRWSRRETEQPTRKETPHHRPSGCHARKYKLLKDAPQLVHESHGHPGT